MIILPAGTEAMWESAETDLDWLRVSNKLNAQSIDQLIAGNIGLADDWHLLSHIALDHYHTARDAAMLEEYQLRQRAAA